MFRVGICDDAQDQIDYLDVMCRCFLSKQHLGFEIVHFHSGEELLRYEGDTLVLLFLDIELGDANGINIMHKIVKENWIWRIVFVSNHKEAVFDTFGIKTLDFGVKPVGFDKVSEWLTVALTEYRTNTVICFEKDKPSINVTDILYIKAEGNYIDVVTKVNSFIYIGHLKDWEDRLDMCNIIRVHKSYIVNLEHVKELRSNIILDNGKEISVGRSYRNLIKKRFKCYNNNYVGLNNGYLCEVIQ